MTSRFVGLGFLLLLFASCHAEVSSPDDESRRLCGNGVCSRHETCETCPEDCGTCSATCGDGTCDGAESCTTCAEDCGSCGTCGDGACGPDETCSSCPGDCGACTATCGDGACAAGETCASCPGDCGTCSGDLLFASGWDNTTDLGCTYTGLIDNVWDDYGGSTACAGDVHDADVVTDVHHDGARALRVTQKPGGINGTDFRIGKQFGNQSEVTILGWVYYAPNYHWASADHKIFITMDNVPMAQNVYINYRGGSDPQHARLCAGIVPVDTIMCADSPQVTVGTWYRIRAHVVAGLHGKVEIWLQPQGQPEVKLHLVNDPDAVQINIDDVDTGVLGGFKYDSTYNLGSSVTAPMYQYVDSIEVHSGLFGGP